MGISSYVRRLRERVGHDLLALPSVTALIFDDRRRVLLVRPRGSPMWVTPGGAIEPGERPADAVVREVWEETGLRVRPERLVGVFGGPEFEVRYPNGDRSIYTMAVFACAGDATEPRPLDGEIAELRWVARDRIDADDVAAWVPRVLAPAWEPGDEAFFAPPEWRPPGEP